MSIKPLHDRILVKIIEAEQKSAGGIIIPDNAKEKPTKGKVVAVGAGVRDESGKFVTLEVKKGDTVLFAKWGGTEITVDGEDLLIMKETDILAIINNKLER